MPILGISKLELLKSNLFRNLLGGLNICDGCQEPVSIIIDGEDKDTVVQTFAQLSAVKPGLTIIKGTTGKMIILKILTLDLKMSNTYFQVKIK